MFTLKIYICKNNMHHFIQVLSDQWGWFITYQNTNNHMIEHVRSTWRSGLVNPCLGKYIKDAFPLQLLDCIIACHNMSMCLAGCSEVAVCPKNTFSDTIIYIVSKAFSGKVTSFITNMPKVSEIFWSVNLEIECILFICIPVLISVVLCLSLWVKS